MLIDFSNGKAHAASSCPSASPLWLSPAKGNPTSQQQGNENLQYFYWSLEGGKKQPNIWISKDITTGPSPNSLEYDK